MICILKREDGEITGWIIAQDIHEARRRAEWAGEGDLAAQLYNVEFPTGGKHELADGFLMLVQP